MTFFVSEKYENGIIRDFIRQECGVSHSLLVKLKKTPCGIMLNGKEVTVRATLHEGDRVELLIEDCETDINPYISAIGEMPEILYEDEAVIAVNKPSGMPTHPSFGHADDSLANRICAYFRKQGKPFVFRAINRLDADTSGIVLIAKNKLYAAKLSKSLENGEFTKTYIAILQGEVAEQGKIEGYIAREGESIIKRAFYPSYVSGSDYSLTRYERLASQNGITMVKARLETGRTHQLRVHFASIGAAICGDTLYGSESPYISRQALHSAELSFPSPINGERITVVAPVPEDIKALIKSAGLYFEKGILN